MLAPRCHWHPTAHHGREPRWHELGLPALVWKGQGEGRGLYEAYGWWGNPPAAPAPGSGVSAATCTQGEQLPLPHQQRLLVLTQHSPREPRGRHLSRGRTDFRELPSEQATFQHAYSPSSGGETRAGNKDNSSVPRLPRLHGRGNAKMYQTARDPGLLPALIHAAVAGSLQAAHSISCDAGGPTSHRKSRSHRPCTTAPWISSPGHTLPIAGVPEQAGSQPQPRGLCGARGSCGTRVRLCGHGEKGRLSIRRPASYRGSKDEPFAKKKSLAPFSPQSAAARFLTTVPDCNFSIF